MIKFNDNIDGQKPLKLQYVAKLILKQLPVKILAHLYALISISYLSNQIISLISLVSVWRSGIICSMKQSNE